jgi:general secretion pathway protein G
VLSLAGFVLLAAAIFLPCYVTRPRESRERVLQQDLFTMRQILDQYTLDNHRHPQSLGDLVTAGYLRQIPVDPMTGRSDTWVLEWSDDSKMPGIVGIHGGHR